MYTRIVRGKLLSERQALTGSEIGSSWVIAERWSVGFGSE